VKTYISTLALLACVTVAVLSMQPVSADEPSMLIEGSASSIGLSPGNVYGPWQFATLDLRAVAGSDDKPGITLVTRHDSDTGAPSSGTTAILDDYHQWSPRLFSYAQVQLSSGTLFPTRGVYLETDPTVSSGFVIAEGYGALEAPIGLAQRYVNIGPELYFPHGSVTIRYIPLWTQGQATASSLEGDLTLGDEGRTLGTLTLQSGVVPAYAATNPAISALFQSRVSAVNLDVKHWFQPRFGYEIGVDAGHASDRFTGKSVYDSFGATFGVFVGVGHSATMP
jgi:YaiO family outer membrane protein